MRRLARAAAVAALVTAPLALAAPASASCPVLTVAKADVYVCAEPGYVCAAADTLSADAGACLYEGQLHCYVDLPNRPLLVCA